MKFSMITANILGLRKFRNFTVAGFGPWSFCWFWGLFVYVGVVASWSFASKSEGLRIIVERIHLASFTNYTFNLKIGKIVQCFPQCP